VKPVDAWTARLHPTPQQLGIVADFRRREAVYLCVAILATGAGIGYAYGLLWPLFWAVLSVLCLLGDRAIFDRINQHARARGRLSYGEHLILLLSALANSAVFGTTGVALWLVGSPHAIASAVIIWAAAAVRTVNDIGRMPALAVVAALPALAAMLIMPLLGQHEEGVGAVVQMLLPFFGTGFLVGYVALFSIGQRRSEDRLKAAHETLAISEADAQHKALHDPLSGLANRRHFTAALSTALQNWADGNTGIAPAVLYLDVDRFKDVNDTLGHHVGDTLIQAIADRLSAALPPNALLARFGGDEFALLLSASNTPTQDANIILTALADPFHLAEERVEMAASCGIAVAAEPHIAAADLIRQADIAMYRAKATGCGQWRLFTQDMEISRVERRALELDLRTALASGDFQLAFQPLVSARDPARITGVEALLRWSHPTRGSVSPAEFIPIAEEAGLMPALGLWVLREAMIAACRWPSLTVAINISPLQVRGRDLAGEVAAILAETGAKPSAITLEITESVLLEGSPRTRAAFAALKALGVNIALDDFGTGYSSLSYLRDYPFDKLKIDRSFVQGLELDGQAIALMQGVIALGHGLGMSIVAEGVETAVQERLLRVAGCTELQGFRFHKPQPSAAIDVLVAAQARQVA
jgi:diguanylate cyclase (GGDEF)-like protein